MTLSCFTEYDVRGRVGVELDMVIARRIGAAFATVVAPNSLVLGRDCRASSENFLHALADGATRQGANVIDIGLAGTEEVYFATDHLDADGGIAVTASHNPIDYNGMKFVGRGARPLGLDEFANLKGLSVQEPASSPLSGSRLKKFPRDAYAERISGFVNHFPARPLKVLVNPGNGVAGPAFDAIVEKLAVRGFPLTVQKLNYAPDGAFPNGVPNPLLPENRPATAKAVRETGADFGVAWDGDFDRCFFFDENGAFVNGEYVVALLAGSAIAENPGATIVHDPRVCWNTLQTVNRAGGRAVRSKTGHTFMKATMRQENAVYGGEMSAHHYFRDFMFCDSGMIPVMIMIDLLGRSERPLSELVRKMRKAFPSSGEINYRVTNPDDAITRVEEHFAAQATDIDRMDGLSLSFDRWRFNLRKSNTEPMLRLNVEARGDGELVSDGVARISETIQNASDRRTLSQSVSPNAM